MVAFSDIFMINDFQIILSITFLEAPKDLSETVCATREKAKKACLQLWSRWEEIGIALHT